METTNIIDFARRDGMTDALTELLRTGAQELIATAVGPVALLCRPRCSFKPPFVRRRQGFSSPVLSGGVADCRSR
jgi:hypothetical protein